MNEYHDQSAILSANFTFLISQRKPSTAYLHRRLTRLHVNHFLSGGDAALCMQANKYKVRGNLSSSQNAK